MTAIQRRASATIALALALLLALALSVVAPASRTEANPPPDGPGVTQVHDFEDNDDERGLAFRVVRLSGSPNTLIGTFEHWVPSNPSTNVPYVIKKSTNDGASWETIATVEDGNSGGNHPWTVKWTPAIVELPAAVNGRPAGTLIMAAAVHSTDYRTEIQSWYSTNGGVSWTWDGVIVASAQGNSNDGKGVWEPWLFIGGSGQLVMQFADDDHTLPQVVAQYVSTDGGDSWGSQTDIVAQSGYRPGMPATTKVGDGTYRMVYEVCDGGTEPTPPTCPVHTKTSADGVTWPSGLGTVVQSYDGRYAGGGPNIAYLPGQGSQGQLVVSSHAIRLLPGPTIMDEEEKQTFFVSYDNGTTWNRMGAPLDASIPTNSTDCGTVYNPNGSVKETGYNWSGTLLPSVDGNSLRWFTTTHRDGSDECGVVSAKANVGALPYTADFTTNDSGWVPYGGNWNVNTTTGKYQSSADLSQGPKALAGSTGWTNYTVSADVTPTTGGDAGVLYRVSASDTGADEMSGYYAGIGVGGGLFIGKMWAGSYSTLGTQAVTGGVTSGSTYKISVTANGAQHTVKVLVGGVEKASLTVTDTQFIRGQIGLRNMDASATFDNVSVTAVPDSYSQTFTAATAPELVAYGGTWAVNSGKLEQQNSSATDGPKVLVGSPTWTDYTAAADVSVNSSAGDAGVLIRVGHNPGTGPDSHTGYFAGISTQGNLFIGRMDSAAATPSYEHLDSIAITGGVSANTYYRVSFEAEGSVLTATVTPPGSPGTVLATLEVTDSTYGAGSVGLRSYEVGAKFDNFTVS